MPDYGATSSFSGGQSGLNARPYGQDTSIEDIRKYLTLPTDRRPAGPGRGSMAPSPHVTTRQQLEALGGGAPKNDPQTRIMRAQADMAEAQARAATMSGPVKMLHGAQIGMGYIPDEDRMSGAERQAYLPQSAQAAGTLGPSRASLMPEAAAPADDTPDSGAVFRAALLGNALQESNAAYSARQQQQAMNPGYGGMNSTVRR